MTALRCLRTTQNVAAFFFFSWVIKLLWNSILVDQLRLAPAELTYWQAAALWFLVSILLAWTGLARRPGWLTFQIRWSPLSRLTRALKREIRSQLGEWARAEESEETDGLGLDN